MPYTGERANKASHQSIVDNPTVAAFLQQCNYLKEPSEREAAAMTSAFALPPEMAATLPDRVVAIDGSPHEGSVDEKLLPSTRIGYVQIGAVLIDLKRFSELWVREGRFVDPFAVARLDEANDRLIFTVPGSNTTYRGNPSVRASFRAAVDEHFASEATSDSNRRSNKQSQSHAVHAGRPPHRPSGHRRSVAPSPESVFPTDLAPQSKSLSLQSPKRSAVRRAAAPSMPPNCIRIWEDVTDFQADKEAMGRLMNAVEQLLLVHYVRTLVEQEAFATLAATAFFVDGQLAIHGNMAWLHGPILDYLLEVNDRLAALDHPELIILGLRKPARSQTMFASSTTISLTTGCSLSMTNFVTGTLLLVQKPRSPLDSRPLTGKTSSTRHHRAAASSSRYRILYGKTPVTTSLISNASYPSTGNFPEPYAFSYTWSPTYTKTQASRSCLPTGTPQSVWCQAGRYSTYCRARHSAEWRIVDRLRLVLQPHLS